MTKTPRQPDHTRLAPRPAYQAVNGIAYDTAEEALVALLKAFDELIPEQPAAKPECEPQ